MNWKKLAFGALLSGALIGTGCGGDDGGGGGGGGGGETGDTMLGGMCTADMECMSGECESSGGFCTEAGELETGCTASLCPDGFTCVVWGSEGADGGPRPVCVEQAGECMGDPVGGETYTFVLNALDVGRMQDDGSVPGLNLDGRNSDEEDEFGCGHADFTSPQGESGVDNQLGRILTALGGAFDVESAINDALEGGSLLVLITVEGVDDVMNDDCVSMTLELGTMEGTGADMPMLDGDGKIAAEQTFNVEASSVGLVVSKGEIRDGRLYAGPVDVSLSIPVQDSALTLNIKQAQVQFDVAMSMIDGGLLAGQLDEQETIDAIGAIDESYGGIAESVIPGYTDLAYDTAEMKCTALSVSLVYAGVPATRGDEI